MTTVVEGNHPKVLTECIERSEPVEIGGCRPAMKEHQCRRIRRTTNFANEGLSATGNFDESALR